MRTRILGSLFILAASHGMAQNIGINTDGATPHPSALLDVDASALASSNKRGILIPRMTAAEMTAIAGPATGLLVFNTTATNFFYFNGTAWVSVGGTAGWGLTGNTGTTPASNFIGTTDNQVLRFRVNNQFAGQLSTTNTGMLSLGLAAGAVNTGASNTFIGNGAGAANAASGNNTYVGTNAGNANATGQQNVYIGRLAGGNATSGSDNVLIGNGAGLFTTANNNVMIGSFAGNANATGGGNTFIGVQAGQASNAGQNTFVGTGAGGTNITGTQNTMIGNGASVAATNLTNATAIGRASRVDASDALVLGSVNGVNGATSTTNVGIGVNAPLDRLHVAGSIRMVDGNQAAGRVMVSNANGTASWQVLGTTTNTWGLLGNAGTAPATHFLGTTDNQHLVLRANNVELLRLNTAGRVEIGSAGNAVPNTPTIGLPKLWVASDDTNDDNIIFQASHNNPASSAAFVTAKSNGTVAAPTAVVAGENMGRWATLGYGTASFLPAGGIRIVAEAAPNATHVPSRINFDTNNDLQRMTIRSDGKVGIGTANPSSLLHVSEGISGATANANAKLVLEDNGSTYAHFLTPTVNESGLLFGNAAGSIRAGFIFNSGVPDGLDFRTGGNNARMAIDATGNVGIGTLAPNRHFEVATTAATETIRITSPTNQRLEFFRPTVFNADWALVSKGSGFALVISGDDFATEVDEAIFTGASFRPGADLGMSLGTAAFRFTTVFAQNGLINTSDARDKTGIRPLDYGLAEVLKLKPVRFQWKNNAADGDKLGLIAQDLQLVLPETVVDKSWQENADGSRTPVPAERLGVYYSDIIPVLIKAIQEQQQQIEGLRAEVEALRTR